jgi:membrane-associated phospholipid phosphatase
MDGSNSRFEGRLGVLLIALGFAVGWGILWTGSHLLSDMHTTRYPMYLSVEAKIPFVHWAMPIYFSLDLAVVMLPFLFKSWRGALPPMATLLVQTLIAVPFFVFLPMQVGFTGEAANGVWGEYVFDQLGLPNYSRWNHVPSLHVAYAFTIAVVLGRNWGHAVFWLALSWAAAVSISTVLVHEHHLIDVLGGLVLFAVTVPIILPFFERATGTRPVDPD